VKQVKLSDQTYEKLKELAEKNKLSLNQMIERLLELYQGGGERLDIKKIIEKQIVLKYDTVCKRCNKPLKAGDIAHYTRYVYEDGSSYSVVICLDCYYQSSESFGKWIVEREKLKREIQALKQYRSKLVKEIQAIQSISELIEIKKRIEELIIKFSHTDKEDLARELRELWSKYMALANELVRVKPVKVVKRSE